MISTSMFCVGWPLQRRRYEKKTIGGRRRNGEGKTDTKQTKSTDLVNALFNKHARS